jgi:hypothetical protein
LELPDVFVLSDGTAIATPADLGARLRAEPGRWAEVSQDILDGTLEKWLRSGGWESLAQRVEELRERGDDNSARGLLHLLGEQVPGPVEAGTAATPLRKEERSAGIPSELAGLQRRVLAVFGEAQERLGQIEQHETAAAGQRSAGAREHAAAARAEIDTWLHEIHDIPNGVRGLLDAVNLQELWREVPAVAPCDGANLAAEVERSASQARQGLSILQDRVEALQRRRDLSGRLAFAVALTAVLSAALLAINWPEIREPRSQPPSTATRQTSAPRTLQLPYEEMGLCPFECCTYREWRTVRPVSVLEERYPRARSLAIVPPGEWVRTLTGVVVTETPGSRRVGPEDRCIQMIGVKIGDTVPVLNYRGEGFWRVWFNGSVAECRFEPDEKPRTVWWIKLQLRDGRVGWTRDSDRFNGRDMDRCS